MSTKNCLECQQEYQPRGKYPQKFCCRSCGTLYNNRKNRDRGESVRLQKLYGLSLEDFKKLSELQGHICAICDNNTGSKKLSVDHDHDTTVVRGLLCTTCNLGIGYFKHDIDRLYNAIRYLEVAKKITETLESGVSIEKWKENFVKTIHRLNRIDIEEQIKGLK